MSHLYNVHTVQSAQINQVWNWLIMRRFHLYERHTDDLFILLTHKQISQLYDMHTHKSGAKLAHEPDDFICLSDLWNRRCKRVVFTSRITCMSDIYMTQKNPTNNARRTKDSFILCTNHLFFVIYFLYKIMPDV